MTEKKAEKPQNFHNCVVFFFFGFAAKCKPQHLILPQALAKDSGWYVNWTQLILSWEFSI